MRYGIEPKSAVVKKRVRLFELMIFYPDNLQPVWNLSLYLEYIGGSRAAQSSCRLVQVWNCVTMLIEGRQIPTYSRLL